jgi:hypothetical protein
MHHQVPPQRQRDDLLPSPGVQALSTSPSKRVSLFQAEIMSLVPTHG